MGLSKPVATATVRRLNGRQRTVLPYFPASASISRAAKKPNGEMKSKWKSMGVPIAASPGA
jgi:hypothetical protein